MRVERIPSKDIGLRHVLENGLSLVRGEAIGEERRRQVLESLLKIFSEADRGSEALGVHNLTAALNEKRALERFSAFYRHLRHEFGDEVPNRLGEAKVALDQMIHTGTTDQNLCERLEQVLSALLHSIRRERAFAPLKSPREIVY